MNKEKTIAVLPGIECCGCGACYNICPQSAISMQYDAEGFLYPRIDEKLCISCGKCRKACPSVSGQYNNNPEPDCYVAMADDDIRKNSSSGGMFTLFAEYVLDRAGAVCGAAYDSEFRVLHMIVNNKKDLEKLKKSKYVQSDTGRVYTEIQKLLKEGRPVLFCGCPCQVAGLRTYLGRDYEKLYTIDLMCHGAPSPGLFKKYLQEKHGGRKITHVGFRDKDYYGWSTEMTVKYSDGTVYHGTRSVDPFYRAFLPLLSTRPHCGQCRFSVVPRQGDITLADFWGVEKYDPKYSDGKGTSILIINSPKGDAVLKEVRRRMPVCDPMPLEYIYKTGQPFDHCFKSHPARNRFMDLVQYMSMEKAYEYAVKRKFDVAIMGVWSGCNYGSIMTYYGLCRLVESFGLSVLMIDKPRLNNSDPELMETHSRRFARENYKEISRSYSLRELRSLNAYVDTFIIGSDQVWNYGISRNFGRSYFFDFVDDDKKKIAYASSFGHDGFFASKAEKETTAHLLNRFDAISVRESRGVSICRDTFHVKAVQVLDPVFAADPAIYDEIASRSSVHEEETYVVSYILDPTPEKREALQYVADHYNCKLINMLDGIPWKFQENKEKLNLPNTVENLQVEDWLYYLKHSRFVITDSCHGASFAILFKRPFICIANRHRGLSRFESLLSLFDLKDRYVTDPEEIMKPAGKRLLSEIDYDAVYRILDRERIRSRAWLKNALFSPKVIRNNRAYPIVDQELKISYDRKINGLQAELDRRENSIRPAAERVMRRVKRMAGKLVGKN
ncbi:MAG: polysaccharide pyruvyl transferase family protein [Lachnospiraceae bacterium]|nr:polysaccharide pyruvyl transferase family protein [Lachnospiraceae bacterium]